MADTDTQSKSPDWGAITKWLVLGVVLIVLILVLKQPLSGLVNRATDVQISSKGVTILTAQTNVGDVKYSQEKIKTADVPKLEENNANLNAFVSDNHYVFTLPKGTWKTDDEQLADIRKRFDNPNYTIDKVCVRTTPSRSGFIPNVNIIVETANQAQTIQQKLEVYKTQLTGAKILDEKVDEATNGALLSYTNMSNGQELYYIQRFVKYNDKLYTITATTTFDDDAETKTELLSILNSFKIIEG